MTPVRKFSQFLITRNVNAGIIAFIFTLLSLLSLPGGFFAAVIVGFITLQKGRDPGLFTLAWVAVPAIALFLIKPRFGMFDLILVRALLVWVFALIIRKHGSWRLMLEAAVVLGLLAVVGLHLVIPDVAANWIKLIGHYIKDLSGAGFWKLSATETQVFIKNIAPMATGLLSFIVIGGVFIQLVIARWWQAYMFNPGGFRKEFIQIRMGRTIAIAVLIVIIGMLFKVEFIVDFFPLVLLPFVVAGLSLGHFFVTQKKWFIWGLVLIYAGLFLLPMLVVGLLALAGYFDSWYDIRQRRVVQ